MPLRAALTRQPDAGAEFEELLCGLQAAPKTIACRYLYDERGSRLFEEICRLPEYYPTRTETQILKRHARQIADAIGPDAQLVELGSGASEKTRLLLDELERPAAYVPVDISREQLLKASRRLAADYPGLPVLPVYADFTQLLKVPGAPGAPGRQVVFFPGSTIGNFAPVEARALLARLCKLVGPRGALVVGVDLVKAPEALHAAYNDSDGVTARFNLNVLQHLNWRFAANFDEARFRHAAPWMPESGRVEMQLWCRRDHEVDIGGVAVPFKGGEKVVTEWSHKYTVDSFGQLARQSGWVQRAEWLDDANYFSVQYLEVCPEWRDD